jgi:hypothetical protein
MIRTQTTVGTRIHTRTMAEMMRTRILSSYTAGTFHTHIPSSYTAGTFHTYTDTDCCTRRIRNGPADMHADVLCD